MASSARIDQALDALLAYLIASAPPNTFKYSSRRLKFWGDLQGKTPALFVRHLADEDHWSGEGLQMTEVEVEVGILTDYGANPDAVPDSALDYLAGLVRTALAVDPVTGDYQKLPTKTWPNGTCYYARLEGRSEYSPGDADGKAVASISVRILLP